MADVEGRDMAHFFSFLMTTNIEYQSHLTLLEMHQDRFRWIFFSSIVSSSLVTFASYAFLLRQIPSAPHRNASGELDPSDFFWTKLNVSADRFDWRHVLVLQSLLIHHPNATILLLSSTLNDTRWFLPFRQRGYRISAVNLSSSFFARLRSGGTYFSLDVVLLQSFPLKTSSLRVRSVNSVKDVRRHDRSLQLFDLIKRYHGLTDVTGRGPIVDLLVDRYDLRGNLSIGLIHHSIYVFTARRESRFVGHNRLVLRSTVGDLRWNVAINVSHGDLIRPREMPLVNLSQAEVNDLLGQIIYRPKGSIDTDQFSIDLTSGSMSLKYSLTILIFSRLVTMLTKTMGSMDNWPVLKEMIRSRDDFFPGTSLHIGSDLGQPFNRSAFLAFVASQHHASIFIHDFADDSGVAFCRNALVNLTRTPFLFLLDDDFVFENDSHVDFLLEMLHTSPTIDIIAGKIPEDIVSYNDYSGVFLSYNQTLELTRKSAENRDLLFRPSVKIETNRPCEEVDFVPNVFLARTRAVQSVGWNSRYKTGEHEDFFLRFRQANRTVLTCRFIDVHHHQTPWWKTTNTAYFQKRARVYHYFKEMLKAHGYKKFIAFKFVHIDWTMTKNGTS